MDFLRKLFGGSRGPTSRYLTYHVRPKRCDETVEVRVDLFNELSQTDDGGFFVRKLARGERCPFPAELHITFDKNRRVVDVEVQDGELVEGE